MPLVEPQEEAVDLAFSERGQRGQPVVVLLHGFPLHGAMWRHQADALAAAGHHVIVPDLRGHGKSPRPGEAATMARCAADVRRLLDTLALDSVVLGGFGTGGYVALEAAAWFSGRLRGLILASTRAEPDSQDARKQRYATAEDVKIRGVDTIVETMLPRFLTEKTRRERPALAEEVRAMMRATPQVGAIAALHGIAERSDRRALLSRLAMPALVLAGAQDPVTPVATLETMARALPRSQLVVIPGASHLAPLEAPEAVNGAMVRWLGRVSAEP